MTMASFIVTIEEVTEPNVELVAKVMLAWPTVQ
jgi:hypothetical protein